VSTGEAKRTHYPALTRKASLLSRPSALRRCGALSAFFWLGAVGAEAQDSPTRLTQDEPDPRGRSSVAVGSGARAFGMGGAFLARADDATAASWNPAGLSYLRRPELSGVGVRNSFTTLATTRGLNQPGSFASDDHLTGYAPDFLAATYPVGVRGLSGAVQLSFQRVLSYTGERSVRVLDIVSGRITPRAIESDGGFDVLALGSGFQVYRTLRLGVTLNHWFNGYHQVLERTGLARAELIRITTDLDLSGWNLNAGAIYTPAESVNVGVIVKTGFSADVTLTRRRLDRAPTGETSTNFSRSRGVGLDFPWAAGAGVSWRPISPLTLSLDYTRTAWKEGRIANFFVLPAQGQPGAADSFASLPFPSLFPSVRQKHTDQVRLGAEYVLLRGRFTLPLRAGYFSDRQFFPDVDGRAPRFDGYTAGVGIGVGPLLLDGAFVLETGGYVDPIEGNLLESRFRRVLVSVIYRHGGR
jgi:long-subunit fatty acid transport protein